jgi:hypothetical protein
MVSLDRRRAVTMATNGTVMVVVLGATPRLRSVEMAASMARKSATTLTTITRTLARAAV